MQFSRDSATLLILRLDQLAADVRQSRVRQFTRRDVDKRHHSPSQTLPSALGVAPILNRKAGAIRAPQYLVVRMDSFAGADCAQDPPFLPARRCSIRTAVMDECMHILAQKFIRMLIAQCAQARWVAEGAAA